MGNGTQRVALGVLVVLLLVSTLAAAAGARASSTPNYTLLGYVEEPGLGAPVPAGVTVDLISSATHQVYSTTTQGTSGQFSFSSQGNAPNLAPGWWGVWVPPQANVTLLGSQYAVLPQTQSAQYFYENTSQLVNQNAVTIHGVQTIAYNASISGVVKYNGQSQGGAQVQLLAPLYNGFVLAHNATVSVKTNTTVVGFYNISVPWGTWVLHTVVPGSPAISNLTAVTVAKPSTTVSPVLSTTKSYVTWGFAKLKSAPTQNAPNGGNVTVFDPATGYVYSSRIDPGGFYTVETYGSQTFDVIISIVGYSTVWYPLTVSPSNPTGGPNPHNVLVAPIPTPASYLTTLDWSKGFSKLNVTTAATLANDSVIPELANASVGQLWGQLALDWQHNLTFGASNLATVEQWLNSSGPFFPAGQAQTTVNGVGYGQPTNDTYSATSTCATWCGLASNAGLALHWSQAYNVTSKLAGNAKSYNFSLNFKHPTNGQAFNYSVLLPPNYVLSAGANVPAQSVLVPKGPGGTWTAFTLVSKPSNTPDGTATFSAVKYGNVTAAVNISASEFTWSEKNVRNTTHANYTVVAGVDENLTFSALNSTFPAGTNGTLFQWNFGDSTPVRNNTTGTIHHLYHAAGNYLGSVTVTSSGGKTSNAPFRVYAGSSAPTAVIAVNDTHVLKASNGVPYVIVNWSTPLQFNATGSTSTLYSGAPISGLISIATFNISNYGGGSVVKNYTRAGVLQDPFQNDTMTFLGGGHYLSQGTASGVPIAGTFLGWQYNVTLKVWDAGGHNATTSMVVLVRDTQKPTPVITLKDSKGKVIPASGIVEGANHTAFVQFSFTNSTDPNNGSVVYYNISITNAKDSTVKIPINVTAASPNYPVPAAVSRWMAPESGPYTVNLTVTDRAGNKAFTTSPLTIAADVSARPVLSVTNLTVPTTMTDGTSYTLWANVTDTVGANSIARNVTVRFYLLPPSGTGTPIGIGGAITWYGYHSGTVNSSAAGTGTISVAYNHTFRAQTTWTPSRTGTWALWVNATASNEFPANYASGLNQAHVTVTLNANPIVAYEEYGAIAAVAVVIILAIVFWTRWRSKPSGGKSASGGKLERGSSKKDEDEED